LIEPLRQRPFVPFRICATDGRTFDVRHPDQALVLGSRVILPLGADSEEFAERSQHLAIIHVVRHEELAAGPPLSTTSNG
jgi:hypothetical protein